MWCDLWVFVCKNLWILKESHVCWWLDLLLLPVLHKVVMWLPGRSCVFDEWRCGIKSIHTWCVFAPFYLCLESLLLAVILLFFCVSVHVFKALFHEARFPNKRGLILCLKPNRDRASGEMLKHVAQLVMWSQGCLSVSSTHYGLRQSSSSCNMTASLSFLYSLLKCVNYT